MDFVDRIKARASEILGALAFALLIVATLLYFWGDSWRSKAQAIQTTADTIVQAIRDASGNADVSLKTAAGQVVALGESNRSLKVSISQQNEAINEMARKAVAAGKAQAELQQLVNKAKAQRDSALRRLSDLSITPGSRSDCLQLLDEANEAAEILREAAKETKA